jgi:hypothetical protein
MSRFVERQASLAQAKLQEAARIAVAEGQTLYVYRIRSVPPEYLYCHHRSTAERSGILEGIVYPDGQIEPL